MAAGITSRQGLYEGRVRHLWRHHRMTPEQWMREFEHQAGLCLYCNKRGGDLWTRGRKFREPQLLVVDNEHEPPYRFRGLGHPHCNRIAGLYERALKDPPAWQPGGVAHCVPADAEERKRARAVQSRDSKRRLRAGGTPLPVARARERGERQTYHYPMPDEAAGGGGRRRVDLVAAALAEAEDAAREIAAAVARAGRQQRAG